MLAVFLRRGFRASRSISSSSSISSISISSSISSSSILSQLSSSSESGRFLSSSSSSSPSLPARTAAALADAPVPLSCVFVPGAGRGLVIGGAGGGKRKVEGGDEVFVVEEGTTLLRERPLAAVPLAAHVVDSADGGGGGGGGSCVCYGCLRPLRGRPPPPPPPSKTTSSSSSASSSSSPPPLPEGAVVHVGEGGGKARTFCSGRCLASSLLDFYGLESRVPRGWEELEAFCDGSGERFPRVVARLFSRSIFFSSSSPSLAAALDDDGDDGEDDTDGSGDASKNAAREAAREADDALQALCFARVPAPYPPTWVESHGAFVAGLERWWRSEQEEEKRKHRRRRRRSGQNDDDDDGEDDSSPSSSSSSSSSSFALPSDLVPLDSWVAALSRVHLNAFRVDAVWPAATREEMMAAMLSSLVGAGGGGGRSSAPGNGDGEGDGEGEQAGTAVYAAASLANHSCAPSARPSFPRADSTLALVATRALAAGEEVTVSYVDESLGLRERRRALEYGYGFFCRCERCVAEEKEEEERGGGGGGV